MRTALQIVDDTHISVDGKSIRIVSNRDPLKLPWAEMNVDLVIEGTGVFVDEAGASKHLQAGAGKVLITAPGKGDIPTFVMGVNDADYKHEYPIISNASCTTNCMAPFVKVLNVRSLILSLQKAVRMSASGSQHIAPSGQAAQRAYCMGSLMSAAASSEAAWLLKTHFQSL